jgi:hypothetical protein
MSDGTANLYFLNPQTFQRTGEITVHDGATAIVNLNSLDYINGSIFANVWLTNKIAVINPGTGHVTAWIDLTGIENMTGCHCDVSEDVLNGIAYDAQNNRLFVTGKMWSNVFQIEIVPPLPQSGPSPRLAGRELGGVEARLYGFMPIIFSTSASIMWNFLPSLASLTPTSSREVK